MWMNFRLLVLLSCGSLVACTTIPTGPSMMVLPGSGKDFEQFRVDDAECRQFALDSIGGKTATQAATESGVASAAVGAAVGAAAGAAIGGHQGAGVGAGSGLLIGGLAGTGASQSSAYGSQRRYDNHYVQCMYAKGHRIPVSGRFMTEAPRAAAPYPPPPPGAPPPPPPGAPLPSMPPR